jgi:NitT/TauT family transport system permease protein
MKKLYLQLSFYMGVILLWQLLVTGFNVPNYLLPTPLEVINQLIENFSLFVKHTGITLFESLLGFILGAIFAFIISIGIVYSKIFEDIIQPILIMSQTTPRIAIAPFLIIWLGYTLLPKIIIAALICFFPIVISSVKGLKSSDRDLLNLMKSYGAKEKDIFLKIKLPSALPYIMTGLKIGITWSVIGAVVAEFVGADAGLGYLIVQGSINFDTSLMFASLLILALLGIVLFKIMSTIEKKVLYWNRNEKDLELF